jgi:hypothetical protein
VLGKLLDDLQLPYDLIKFGDLLGRAVAKAAMGAPSPAAALSLPSGGAASLMSQGVAEEAASAPGAQSAPKKRGRGGKGMVAGESEGAAAVAIPRGRAALLAAAAAEAAAESAAASTGATSDFNMVEKRVAAHALDVGHGNCDPPMIRGLASLARAEAAAAASPGALVTDEAVVEFFNRHWARARTASELKVELPRAVFAMMGVEQYAKSLGGPPLQFDYRALTNGIVFSRDQLLIVDTPRQHVARVVGEVLERAEAVLAVCQAGAAARAGASGRAGATR